MHRSDNEPSFRNQTAINFVLRPLNTLARTIGECSTLARPIRAIKNRTALSGSKGSSGGVVVGIVRGGNCNAVRMWDDLDCAPVRSLRRFRDYISFDIMNVHDLDILHNAYEMCVFFYMFIFRRLFLCSRFRICGRL